MGIIDELDKAGLLAFNAPYLLGGLRDRVSGNTPTITTPLRWTHGAQSKRGLVFSGSSCLEYADTAATQMSGTSGTYVGFLRKGIVSPDASYTTLFSKESGAGLGWAIYRSAANIIFANDTTFRTISSAGFAGKSWFGTTLVNGATPKGYADGAYVGDYNGALTIAPFAYPLHVGNDQSGLYPSVSGICWAMLIGTALNAGEMLALYTEMNAVRTGGPKCYGFITSPATTKTAPLLHWKLDERNSSGQFADSSAFNRPSTTVSGAGFAPGLFSKQALKFNGGTGRYVKRANGFADTIASNNNHSISFWFTGDAAAGTMSLLSSGLNYYFATVGNTKFQWYSGTAQDHAYTIQAGARYHVYLERETSKLYVNGVEVPKTSGSLSATPADTDLYVGSYGAAHASLNGQIEDLELFAASLGASERKAKYIAGAKRVTFDLPMRDETEVTLAPVTAANVPIANTPFRTAQPGTWEIRENRPGRKYFVGSTAYVVAKIPIRSGVGTFVVDFLMGVTTPTGFALSIGNDSAINNAATRAIYTLQMSGTVGQARLYRLNAGTITELCYGTPLVAEVPMSMALTRAENGDLSVLVKGGPSYPKWALMTAATGANPVNNTAITSFPFLTIANNGVNTAHGITNIRILERPLTAAEMNDIGV